MRPINLFYVTAGFGHRTAARAIREALDERDIPNVLTDLLAFSNKLFKWTYSSGYDFISEHARLALKGISKLTDQPRESSGVLQLIDYLSLKNVEGFEHYVEDNSSATSICTHFFPANVLSRLKEEGIYSGRIYVTVTDYGFHRMWYNHGVEKYFVASETARRSLLDLGAREEQIITSGIPIFGRYRRQADRTEILRKYDLGGRRFTLLFVTSAIPDSLTIRILEDLFESGMALDLILVAGRNRDLLEKIEHFSSNDRITLHRYGFVNDLQDMMSIADLLLTKPGGLIVSEALAKGLPLLMFNPIPYQETQNAAYIKGEGAGMLATSPREIPAILAKLCEAPDLLKAMGTNAKRIAHTEAANTIVETVLKDLKRT